MGIRLGPGQETDERGSYEDGFDIDIAPTTTGTLALACEAVADMLGDININAMYNEEPSSVFYPRYKDRTQQVSTANIPAFGSEPIQLHRFSYDPTATWGVGWDHPWFTEIMLRAMRPSTVTSAGRSRWEWAGGCVITPWAWTYTEATPYTRWDPSSIPGRNICPWGIQ